MSGQGGYVYPRWAFPTFGALLVVTFVYLYFEQVIATSLTLLNPNNTYWIAIQWSKATPLFGALVLVLSHLPGGIQGGFFLAAEISFVAFAISAYVLILGTTRRWEVGVIGAVITTASPTLLYGADDAAYSVILGLALLFPGVLLGGRLAGEFKEGRVLLLTLFSVGLAVADPILGLVLGGTLVVLALRAYQRKNWRFAIAPMIAIGVSALAFLFVSPGPDLPSAELGTVFLLLAAATGAVAFYFGYGDHADSVIPLGALSILAGAASFLLGTQYAMIPLLLLSSTLLLNLRRPHPTSMGDGAKFVNLDVARLASIVFIVLIVGADLGVSVAASRQAASQEAATASRYGNPELFQAMAWIDQNTPTSSVVLSEYPLSQWVDSLGGRASLSNFNVGSSYSSFLASYDADTMLNSTYEMRNGYMRVRDWAPVAPQRSPLIAVASGNQYLNVLYIDENHFNLLDPTGNPISVSYSNVTKTSSGFSEVNGSLALVQKYIISGVNVERDVIMGQSAQVTLAYAISANQTGLVSGAEVQLWVSKDRTIGYTSLAGGTLQLDLDAGNLVVSSKGPSQSVTFGPDKVYGQQNLLAKYSSTSMRFAFSISISGQNIGKVTWAKGLEVVRTVDLFAKYHVSYVVVPTLVKTRQVDLFGLYFPTFTSVYQNDRLTIYQVGVGGP